MHDTIITTATIASTATSATSAEGRDATTGRFLSGNVGGPGRKIGSRNLLTTQFLDDLRATWVTHGRSALERCAIEEPAQFVRVVAGLLPHQAHLSVEQQTIFADISDYSQAFAMAVGIIKGDPPPLPLLTDESDDAE